RTASALSVVYSSFYHVPAPTVISTLSLHDALRSRERDAGRDVGLSRRDGRPAPLRHPGRNYLGSRHDVEFCRVLRANGRPGRFLDRKSTRLNSSHGSISYAVFCLKKKKTSTLNST